MSSWSFWDLSRVLVSIIDDVVADIRYTNDLTLLPLDNVFLQDVATALGVNFELPLPSLRTFDAERDTDIEIVLSGTTVRTHRAMLYARSEYFRSLLSSKTREVTQNVINLQEYQKPAVI